MQRLGHALHFGTGAERGSKREWTLLGYHAPKSTSHSHTWILATSPALHEQHIPTSWYNVMALVCLLHMKALKLLGCVDACQLFD